MMEPDFVIVCPACDLLIKRKALPLRRHAHCPRCHQHLYGRYAFRPSQLMALTITGLLLLPSAFFEPLIYLRLAGVNTDADLLKGIFILLAEHEYVVAALVLWCAVLAPVGLLLGIFALASGLAKRWRILPFTLKAVAVFRHWAMLEVYIASLLVALFKLVDIADVRLGGGLLSLGILMLLNLTLLTLFDPSPYWRRVAEERDSDDQCS
ncbi:paraquat-inducible protein A [Aeromonas cavernicola]|uniref:Paraquat-inducible protein A n=1 Tax=Aeromonas cavernicola TaxID=1006623 RepID=A0A2H9U4B3_9GAMM|nr:paraquat-inducible protein A [Aeromonas cavernicola]PJG58844.1 paraquat-inducible protein A [Aeromonas cavernicola]